jgi:3-oxoacyl-[acyl-carrier protein] reductase
MVFDGKTALVTGASRGIGRAIACTLAAQGCDVAINYRQDEAAARETAAQVERHGRRALLLQADVADHAQAQAMVATVLAQWDRLDVLVNNAGITRDKLLATMEPEDIESVLRTNLLGVIYPTQAVTPVMVRQRWGRIVNLSSSAASKPGRGQSNYAASKGAVEAFTRAMAVELASRNVLVNAVAPGVIETEMSAAVRQHAEREIMDRLLLKRYGSADEVGEAVAFLASPANRYITGEVLHLDGGLKMA